MSTWSWNVSPLEFKDRCAQCTKTLRLSGEVVTWDGSNYHVGCLLDWLAMNRDAPINIAQMINGGLWP